jgi:GntR family transcriptional regulator
MKDSGLPSHSIILEFEIIPASELATKLDLEEEDAVIKLVRVRYADGDPVQYVTSFIPWKVAPGLVYEDCQGSLFELLQTKFGIHMHRSIDTLQPMLADEKVCRYLQIPVHSPVMSIESINYDIHDVPIEHSRTFVRGDRARFVLEREYER